MSSAALAEELKEFSKLINENRYNYVKLAYIIFGFGQPGTPMEKILPYDWQVEQWYKLSVHMSNPATRFETYRLIISSGNGAAKTAFGAMTFLMLMYTQRVRGRITANTDPQMTSIVWPEYDIWCRRARYFDVFFEKFGKSIKARDPKLAETWRLDTVTWNEQSPASISGLHNKGGVALYIFEEAPGIPAVIWDYTKGAFTETDTIKIHLAFGNSDDPESKFEQNMTSPLWRALRIDTRTLKHIDPKEIEAWLQEAGGNEDNDDFRVRVRGLPRKTAKDSIIRVEDVDAALERRIGFDTASVKMLPCILTCDPAWTGGDETTLWYKQGNYRCLLEKFKLDKSAGETHQYTYNRLCYWEHQLKADAVFIDQGEGTGLYTLATNAGKTNWYLISFAGSPNDTAESKDSEYANIRAQMFYETGKALREGEVLDSINPEHIDDIRRQLTWTKGGRHKITGKKIAEPKLDIKKRVGQSPDVADGCVLCSAVKVTERLPEHDMSLSPEERYLTGQGAYKMPEHGDPYRDLYDEQGLEGLYGGVPLQR